MFEDEPERVRCARTIKEFSFSAGNALNSDNDLRIMLTRMNYLSITVRGIESIYGGEGR